MPSPCRTLLLEALLFLSDNHTVDIRIWRGGVSVPSDEATKQYAAAGLLAMAFGQPNGRGVRDFTLARGPVDEYMKLLQLLRHQGIAGTDGLIQQGAKVQAELNRYISQESPSADVDDSEPDAKTPRALRQELRDFFAAVRELYNKCLKT